MAIPSVPNHSFGLFSNRRWSIQSNAADRSKNVSAVTFPLFMLFKAWLITTSRQCTFSRKVSFISRLKQNTQMIKVHGVFFGFVFFFLFFIWSAQSDRRLYSWLEIKTSCWQDTYQGRFRRAMEIYLTINLFRLGGGEGVGVFSVWKSNWSIFGWFFQIFRHFHAW